MDSPFYRSGSSNWPYPTPPPSRYHYKPTTTHPIAGPKVVTIPVHFVGSKRSRSDSAVKIQKAFRGYLVRKSARTIAAIRAEVNQMEKKIGAAETAELMRRDAREGVKLNEMLMSLLLKLDSVRGLDFGIRELRKGVIKKVIALQEAVDAAAAEREIAAAELAEAGNSPMDRITKEEAGYGPHSGDNRNSGGNDSSKCDCGFLEAEIAGTEKNTGEGENSSVERREKRDGNVPVPESVDSVTLSKETMNEEEEVCSASNKKDSSADPEGLVEGEGGEEGTLGEKVNIAANNEIRKRERKSLERLVEDNERMMGMMTDLLQRNKEQTRLLSSLSQRVERLERAFVCQRLRRMKKKTNCSDGGFGDSADSAKDCRKCGKRE